MDLGAIAISRSFWASCLALLVAIMCAAACWRRFRSDAELSLARAALLLTLRVAFVALLAALFIEPLVVREESQAPPVAAILDDSLSMTRNVQDRSARDAALATAAALRGLVADRAGRLDILTLSSRTLDAPPALFSPIRALSNDEFNDSNASSYAQLFLLSDGIDNSRATTRSDLPTLSRPPLDAIILGSSRPAIDWRLTRATADYSYETHVARVAASVELRGSQSPRAASLRLWARESSTGVARAIREERVELAPDSRAELSWDFELAPDSAGSEFLLYVADAEDAFFSRADWLARSSDDWTSDVEFALSNNGAALRFLHDEEEKIKILLVDVEPSYEYRYLRELLRREDGVELHTLLLAAEADDSETSFSREAFERGELDGFDALLVGALPERNRASIVENVIAQTRGRTGSSLWFFNEQTATDALAVLFDADAANFDVDLDANWRLVPSFSTRRIFPELDMIWDDPSALARTAPTRVARSNVRRADVEPLLAARNASTGETVSILCAYERDDRRIAWQAIDEFWRLQTLDDKAAYRTFVLRALEFLTSRPEVGDWRPQTAFEFFSARHERERLARAAEEEETRATCEPLDELTSQRGGATLDLRDLALGAAVARARSFVAERLDALAPRLVETRRPLIPRAVGLPCALALFLGALVLEARLKRRAKPA